MTVARVYSFIGKSWLGVILVCFALVYAASLRFGYVEGDDASSIAYHLYGRNSAIQPPFSPYHSMMDTVLGLLPINEPLLRTVAVGLTSIAAVAVVIFTLALVFDWLKPLPLSRGLIAGVVLLASPEFFYLGLVYLPGVIAMALVLASHTILRRAGTDGALPNINTYRGRATLLLSAVVFGVGAACRWDIAVYGGVIAADLLFGFGDRSGYLLDSVRRRWKVCIVWGGLALLGFFLALVVSGYSPSTVLDEFQKIQNFLGERLSQITETIGGLQPLVTPAFGLFVLVGLAVLLRRRDPLLIVIAVGLVLVLPWVSRGLPKLILPAVPGLVACVVVGFTRLWTQFRPQRWQGVLRFAVAALLLTPWLVGVRVIYDDSAFGPGFETRPYDRPLPGSTQISPAVFGAGTLFPTSEGPRGLFGHAAVLLGGDWRAALVGRWMEMETALDYALEKDISFISTGNVSNFVVLLWLRGYVTQDPRDPAAALEEGNTAMVVRRFTNPAGDALDVYGLQITASQLERLDMLPGEIDQIVIYGFPRTLRALYLEAPDTLVEKLGSVSALLDLARLRPLIAQTAQS